MSDRKYLLQFVESQLLESGYQFVEKLRLGEIVNLRLPVYSTNVAIGKNIYNNSRKGHFLLFHPQKWPKGLVVEVRWQGVNGTVDEKFPFIVMNIKRSGLETVIVMGGEHLKPEVKSWVENQIGYRLIEVFSPTGFQNWVLEGNL
ncbi:MAG: hypothetical protein OXG53_10110 [Chloroflexi bacterium]|nr:hypothetical protein [Chloroflexota bacterium]